MNIWVALRLSSESESKIRCLREDLVDRIPSQFDEETDPHISVLPGAEIPGEEYDTLEEKVENAELPGQKICVDQLGLYPEDDPFVISLEVSVNLQNLRETLIRTIRAAGGHIVYQPVTPHITLFKMADSKQAAESLPEATVDQLKKTVNQQNEDKTAITTWTEDQYQISLHEY
ncbi:2'-5' RNA ligase family protein [Salinarchaeum sp. IM2453]|uniref:2'-5' RNA ligase family protein n=1 Tax=Salinarchaeum sp. IM2453 TaxID=2862870 RepID=UPI001C83205C|nr:2'-5' RNA ligase family protein [Salinarchaeum sp. IM2453]QZA89509.1 2'-5' RNA ligase family protein [Salinarchaeum sp. IM2453]